MTKGNRKRSNKVSNNKKSETKIIKAPKKEKTIYDEFPVKTLNQNDGNRMKEIFELSNNVAALIRDYADKAILVKKMRKSADTIENEKQPLMIQVANNLYKTERDYKKIASDIRKQADIVEKQLVLVKGQISHRYEDYVGSLIRHKRFVDDIIKTSEIKTITGHRPDAKTKEEEEVLFEKEFEEMTDKDIEDLRKLNKALQKRQDKQKE